MKNHLAEETSPYLLQHKDNPVHWHAWSPETLELAKRENKPILLSVGYAACHWCHVMAHESFEDEATAQEMNARFINIKVDREERPDIDQIYQHALALLGEHGGWPLTMFLTPDAQPFWGGTYFPKESRYGRPAFVDVLRTVHNAWAEEPEKIGKNVETLAQGLQQLAQPTPGKEIPANVLAEVGAKLAQHVDMDWGGFGSPPKFPQPYVWEALWRAHLRTGDETMRKAVTVTLDRMCQGGIYDHVGGGFARYATDAHWLVPHFEKMLYDNAQLIDLLVLVWQATKSPLYEARIRETARWVLREMIAEGGGFAATYDADSEGEEGKFYLWSEAEIDALLGENARLYKEVYGVTEAGNWEEAPGRTILHRNHAPALRDADTEAKLAAGNETLYAARAKRIWPGWDDKVLADWNGLMIAALANAGRIFEEPAWVAAAQRAYDFVVTAMMDGDNRLKHSYRAGTLRHPAALEDYANMIRAAIALYETTGNQACIDQARAWVKLLDAHFWDGAAGGWFATADDTSDVIVRAKHSNDNAVPAGNGTLIAALAKLEAITGEAAYGKRAHTAITAFAGELGRNFLPLMGLLNGAEILREPVQVVIVGERGETATEALRRAVDQTCVPARVLQIVTPGTELPQNHPAHGKAQIGGQATAYVCRGPVCSLPVTEPPALAELL